MKEIRIIGVLITDRIKEAGRTQNILTRHSGIIRSRLGFHELNDEICSRKGVIVLHLTGDPHEWDVLEKDLGELGGVEIQKMSFLS